MKRILVLALLGVVTPALHAATLTDKHPSKFVIGQPSIYPVYWGAGGFPSPNGGGSIDARGFTTIAGTGFVYVTDRTTFGSEKVIVSDRAQHRVLIWNAAPDTDFAPANVVVGQPDFTSGNFGRAADRLYEPMGICVTPAGQLVVAERQNDRVMIWNTLPTSNGAAADVVLGQKDKTSKHAVNVGRGRLAGPEDVAAWGTILAVADRENSRIMIWKDISAGKVIDGQEADLVLGQGSFENRINDREIPFPRGIAFSPDGRLVSATQGPKNMLIWNSIADLLGGVKTDTAPSIVINLADDIRGVSVGKDGRLAAADAGGSKVLIWDKFPTMNDQAPDRVIVPNGDLPATGGGTQPLKGAIDVAWNADEHLYVSHGGLAVMILDPNHTTAAPRPLSPKFLRTDVWVPTSYSGRPDLPEPLDPIAHLGAMLIGGVEPMEWTFTNEGWTGGTLDRKTGDYLPEFENPHDIHAQKGAYIQVKDAVGDKAKIRVRSCFPPEIRFDPTGYSGISMRLNASGGGTPYGSEWMWEFAPGGNRSGGTLKKPEYGSGSEQDYTPGPTSNVADVIVARDANGMEVRAEIAVKSRLKSFVASRSFHPDEPFQTLKLKVNDTVQFTASGGTGEGYRWGNYNNYYNYRGSWYGNGTVDPATGLYTAKKAGSDAVYVNDSGYNAFTVNIEIIP